MFVYHSVLFLMLLVWSFKEADNIPLTDDLKDLPEGKEITNNKDLTDDTKETAENQRDKDEESKDTDANEAGSDGDSDDDKPVMGSVVLNKTLSKKEIDLPKNTGVSARMFTSECLDESKADFKDVDKIKNGDWDVTETDEIKRFALCYLVKFDLMSPQGVLKLDHSLSRVEPSDKDTLETIIDNCLQTQPRDIDTAWSYLKCYSDRVHKYPILIRDT